jgi:hypothetical protein
MILFWNFLSKKLFKKYKTKLLLKQRFIAPSIAIKALAYFGYPV